MSLAWKKLCLLEEGGLPQESVNPSPRLLFLLRERCRHSPPPPFTLPCHRTKPPKRLLLLLLLRRSNSPQKRRRRRKKESVALNGREPRSVHLPVCCTHSQQGGGWRRPTYIARKGKKISALAGLLLGGDAAAAAAFFPEIRAATTTAEVVGITVARAEIDPFTTMQRGPQTRLGGKKTCASWMFFLESGNCGALAARFFRCLQGSQTSGRAIFFFFFSKRRESICSVRGFCFFRLFLFPANHKNVSFLFKRRTGASADPGNLFDFFSLSFRLISHAIFARARQPNYSPTFPDFFL